MSNPLPTSNMNNTPEQATDVPRLTLVNPAAEGANAQSTSTDPDRRYWLHNRWRRIRRKGATGSQDEELLDEDELCKNSLAALPQNSHVDTCPLEQQYELLNPATERLLSELDPTLVAKLTGPSIIDYKSATAEANTTGESSLDIIYENQNGVWLFGRPYFSEKPGHVPTWTTVDYREAQNPNSAAVPDPSWEWAWPSWYIDMSHDVDENGWQYSLAFSNRFCWHGNHPWFHSFVRRRRWLRLRVKRSAGKRVLQKREQQKDCQTQVGQLVHVPVQSRVQEGSLSGWLTGKPGDLEELRKRVSDLPSLLNFLKDSVVDREKLKAIDTYLDGNSQDQMQFPDKVLDIMRLFLYETSRQTFLNRLTERIDSFPDDMDSEQLRGKKEMLTTARRILDGKMRRIQVNYPHAKRIPIGTPTPTPAPALALEGTTQHNSLILISSM
ncbi:hypothetical protein KEM54_000910 [Ascosphaera aggregata]|nr:hypothetical protein KEM54_000910 [Ascosphaera aggregata]